MIGLLAAARERSEAALRRAVWTIAGAGLAVLGLGFAAAAAAILIEQVAPPFLAWGAAAIALFVAAAVAFDRARPPGAGAAAPGAATGSLASEAAGDALAGGDWKHLLSAALEREARDKPARAAAIAAIAGLILGAIEGLDESRPDA